MLSILLIDDEEDVHMLVGELLDQSGFRAVHASSVRQALELLRESTPDVLLLDLMMPDMDGFDFARRLAVMGIADEVPIVVLTALSCDFHEEEVFAALPGVLTLLCKPCNWNALEQALEGALSPERASAWRAFRQEVAASVH